MPSTMPATQMREILGGEFPNFNGFYWPAVEEFRLEGSVWQPYGGDMILPGPAIRLRAEVVDDMNIW